MFDDLLLGEPLPTTGLTNLMSTATQASGERREVALLTEHALSQRQRESTIAALEQAGGKVSGAGGAAELLGIKPTTLASRLNKWGIDTREFRKRAPH